MCKTCFEYSEINAEIMDKNAELIAENRRLRQQLKETQEHLNAIIERAKQLRKSLMEG
jgi:uncharacterized coiled-coil DUF342 family protein